MNLSAAAALAGLLLAGCGSGASQTLRSADDAAQECQAGWSAYPSDGSCEPPAPTATPDRPAPGASGSGAPDSVPPARPSPSPRPASARPTARTSDPTTAPQATRATRPVGSATGGQGSASPAATARPSPSSPAPRPTGPLVITEADSGKTFTISRDTADTLLRLGDGWQWSQPDREGSSVELVQRQFVRDPGYAEWEIRPVSSGTTVVRSTGSLACHQSEPPCMAPNRLFEVRIVVS